jgi:hypothetical protein
MEETILFGRQVRTSYMSGLLRFVAYLSPFSSYLRKFDSVATKAPPSGENNFIQKLDSTSVDTFPLSASYSPLSTCFYVLDVMRRIH